MVNEPRRARVTAVHNNREITLDGQLVIAADGAANSFSRRMGVARRSQSCPAVRAYIACDDNYPELVDFHFLSRCLPLYCWVFPVESGLCNVGLALPPGRNADMLEYLRHVLAQEPVLRDRLRHYELAGRVQGGILRTGLHPGDLVRDRLLAAGDAAALVSPLTGEGIKQALISGELAAQHALRALASGSFTRQALYPYSAKLAHAFLTRNRQLGALNALVSIPGAMNRMVKLLEKDRPTQTLLQKTLTSPHSWGAGSMFSLLSRIMTANLR
jgi:flavin-dependent dehydrogenase